MGDYFWYKLMLLSAELLAKCLEKGLNDNTVEGMRERCTAQWKNAILPDCCALPKDNRPLEDRSVITEADYPEIFMTTLTRILNDTERFPYIPRSTNKEICPKYADDDIYQYYGYRRWFSSQDKTLYKAVFFVRDEFVERFQEYSPCKCDAKAVLEYCEDSDTLDWFAPQKTGSRKARIPRSENDKTSVRSVILMLDKLDFLPDELRQKLIYPFENEKK